MDTIIKMEVFIMDKYREIRPIVLGLAIRDGKLLVNECYDRTRNLTFYRCLGGGIEFLERSEAALKREFKEEINVDIIVKQFLGMSENIFAYEGKNGHEMVLYYSIEIPESQVQDMYLVHEEDDIRKGDNRERRAMWVNISDFKNHEKVLYPDEIFKYL